MADSGQQHLPTAANFILSGTSPGAKALVIATDITRFMVAESGDALSEDWSFAEPSGGARAVAMIVSDTPHVFQIDVGASGYYGYEVMDTCRPLPDSEAGNADLSLLSYLDCCENSFREYQRRVGDVDFVSSFGYLAFHTPFGGMIKGAHRNLMRKVAKARPAAIEVTLMTQPFTAEQAVNWHLVDACADSSDNLLRRHLLRLRYLPKTGTARYKHYLRELDDLLLPSRDKAVAANREVFSDQENLRKIERYVNTGQFPWEGE
ncbi:hypothetical protein [Streptomyces sp. NBC_01260]|uniref:hypothetical protein n=1 Tax=Streptomyces sp. NBC_01260 TaxID=2903801 RepID=UPI002E32B00C|nr:hypothetical protein [Streptomyces sp. NBC_01260]